MFVRVPTIPDSSINPPVKQPFLFPLKRMFFNAFEISADRIPEFWFFSFGYLEGRADLFDQYHCVAAGEAVNAAIQGLRDYANELGLPPDNFESLGMPTLLRPALIEPIDLIGTARRNALAEISLHCFSWHRTYEVAKGQPLALQSTVNHELDKAQQQSFAFNVCLLRSSLDVHKAWLLELINMYDRRKGSA